MADNATVEEARSAYAALQEAREKELQAYEAYMKAAVKERTEEYALQKLGRLDGPMPPTDEYKTASNAYHEARTHLTSAVTRWRLAAGSLAIWYLDNVAPS
jgi:hypothetical protein